MNTEALEQGEIVLSKAGRDRGRAFVVSELLDADYVLLTDGRLRTLDRPKKKKRKHLRKTTCAARLEMHTRLCDADVRKFLASQGYENDRNE